MSGTNRFIAGAFGEGPDGTVYLLHSGKIGGGKKGVGKRAFLEQLHGTMAWLNDGRDDLREVIGIGALGTPGLIQGLATFIDAVAPFRSA